MQATVTESSRKKRERWYRKIAANLPIKCPLCKQKKPSHDFIKGSSHRCKKCRLGSKRGARNSQKWREAWLLLLSTATEVRCCGCKMVKSRSDFGTSKPYCTACRKVKVSHKQTEGAKIRLKKRRFERLRTDPNYRIRINSRARVAQAIKAAGGKKSGTAVELIGCSAGEFCRHLESQFHPGMNWNNYGRYGWHIDHIRPCHTFDLTDPVQQRECFHYTNLRPLWWRENLSRNRK